MCGLVGIIGKPSAQMGKVFRDLLQFDVVRGPHSTGVTAIAENKHFTQKGVVLPPEILYSAKYKKHVTNRQHSIFCYMGHNRWATQGRVTRKNAHPFQHGHITLMHNGTLTTRLPEPQRKFGTDSEGIAHYIYQEGIEAAWKKLNGAAALSFWDQKEQTLNLITNGKRPLSIYEAEDQSAVLWASEGGMVELAADMHNLKLKPRVNPEINTLISLKYYSKGHEIVAEVTPLKPYTPPPVKYGVNNRNTNHRALRWDYKKNGFVPRDEPKKALPLPDKDESAGPFGKLSPPPGLLALRAKAMTLTDFNKLYSGCVICGDSLKGDFLTAVVVDEKHAICPGCIEGNWQLGITPDDTVKLVRETARGA
jgi:predicted glutamine amidotransferase